MSELRPSLAGLVDTGRYGPESYTDVVGCVIRQESWMKKKKKLNLRVDEGLKETTQQNKSQGYGNQLGDERLGLQPRKPNNQDKSSGSKGKYQTDSKRKNRPGNQG